MKPLFNRTFFKFVFGFLGILLVGFLILFAVNAVMFAKGVHLEDDSNAVLTCITSSGVPC